ncbi:MAG: NUMOD3 domain-containing DNA-binding protein [Candidatus Paceibacterota bacterium]
MPSGIYKRKPLSEETKLKIGKANSGSRGFHHSEETKRKIGLNGFHYGMLGKKFSKETIEKLRKIHLGKKLSEETKQKISKILTGRKLSKEHLRKISKTQFKKGVIPKTCFKKGDIRISGENNSQWKGGITRNKHGNTEYKQWRSNVFTRDNWTCQTCQARGCYLEAHHIKSFSRYPELRYEISNGVTLCLSCHKLTDNYGGKKTQL